jgi:hypothetical protein
MDYNSIKTNTNIPFLELDLEFPHDIAMNEILAIQPELFFTHRSVMSNNWSQFVLYGTNVNSTRSGWTVPDNTWTSKALELMPHTVKWFKSCYPSNEFSKIKVACIGPGGSIDPHDDGPGKGFTIGNRSTVNIAVNNPDGAEFHIAQTVIPFQPGSAMLIDFGMTHSVINKSNINRYHILVGQRDETEEFQTKVIESYQRSY